MKKERKRRKKKKRESNPHQIGFRFKDVEVKKSKSRQIVGDVASAVDRIENSHRNSDVEDIHTRGQVEEDIHLEEGHRDQDSQLETEDNQLETEDSQ